MPRVLIVDDHMELRLLFSRGLRNAGFAFTTANNGVEALAAIESDPPDLILLDVFMPEMSGPQFLEHLREKPVTPPIPIVLLSAVAEHPEVEYAMTLVPRKFLRKGSFSMEELIQTVRESLPESPNQN